MATGQQSIEVEGMEAVFNRLQTFEKSVTKKIRRAINANAVDLQRLVKRSIQSQSGQYNLYYNWGRGHKGKKKGVRRGVKHYSSMPDSPPNSNFGKLAEGITITKKDIGAFAYVFVRSRAKYSAALEFGRGGAKLTGPIRKAKRYATGEHARPFIVPVLLKKRKVFYGRIKNAIASAVDGS